MGLSSQVKAKLAALSGSCADEEGPGIDSASVNLFISNRTRSSSHATLIHVQGHKKSTFSNVRVGSRDPFLFIILHSFIL